MSKGNFRKRRKEVDIARIELLPEDVFPEEAIFEEYKGRRVSNILLEFASPLLAKVSKDDFFQFKTMIYFAAISWNFSYFKAGQERKAALDRFLLGNKLFEGENKEKMYTIVDNLSLRKVNSFWQYDFMLVSFKAIKGEKENSVMANAIDSSLMNIPIQ
ncbi:MAG TPA: hypothetical protein PKX79_05140 [Spirochaetota bacterium]|jgi:hypothetical protein|nr:hypothetical protein [Spirochaetota bacterium]OQA96884.1 MAG: hypothetical protein BWY23_01771 [Spirochaetes bacterium ADurb.Bin218]HOK01942.1 hypothetical protein [Spirochaetota bacterium]HOK91618.1 hypothetical protein [Spirochaetota bacterium]HON16341.1 hypothetical protein [Spirochaetota bacterium]